jgi:dihydroorotase
LQAQLLIKNGLKVTGEPIEVAVANGQILAVDTELHGVEAAQTIDLHRNSYVSAGWIDDHTHCYEKLTLYYDDPDEDGYKTGVTTVIDAGSTGADNIRDFYQITRAKKTNVFAMLNIAKTGIPAQNELGDLTKIQPALMQAAVADLPGFIVGLKARISHSVVKENGVIPLQRAKEIQATLEDMPLMVHVGANPPELSDILALMSQDDILTHAYNGKTNGILDADGNVKTFVFAAYRRGVIFDVGHGTDSWDFKTAATAFTVGLDPTSISTDIYSRNRMNGPVYDMATTLDKMRLIGYSLPTVIDMITTAPAANFHLAGKGQLAPGFDADITIFQDKNGAKTLTDSDGNQRTTNHYLQPEYAIVGGEVYALDKH